MSDPRDEGMANIALAIVIGDTNFALVMSVPADKDAVQKVVHEMADTAHDMLCDEGFFEGGLRPGDPVP